MKDAMNNTSITANNLSPRCPVVFQKLRPHQRNDHGSHFPLKLSFSTSTATIIDADDDHYEDKRNSNKNKDDNPNQERSLFAKVDSIISLGMGNIHPRDLRFKCLQLMEDCCRLQTTAGVHSVETLLRRMLKEMRHINDVDGGDPVQGQLYAGDRPFHTVMFGWARLCSRGKDGGRGRGADRIEELIKLMEAEYEYEAETRKKFAREKVLKTIGIEDEKEDNEEDTRSTEDYEGILQVQVDDDQKRRRERLSCQPSVQTYNILLYSLSETAKHIATTAVHQQRKHRGRKGAGYSSSAPSALQIAKRSESTLETMATLHANAVRPNTQSYTYVLSAYANAQAPTSGNNAERVLNMMKRIHEMEREDYENTYGVPYNYSNLDENKQKIVTPDVVCYSNVIKAYGNSSATGSAEKAEEILLSLIQSAGITNERGGGNMGPDAISFETTIRAWANAASERRNPRGRYEAAVRAEAILNLMNEVADAADAREMALENSKKENTAADGNEHDDDGWGLEIKGGTLQDADLLQEKVDKNTDVINAARTTRLRPTLVTYNAVLNAWAKSDTRESAPRAEALLRRMIDPYTSNTTTLSIEPIIRPDSMSFHIVMNAWARFGRYDPNSAQRAEELLDLMHDMYKSGDYGEEMKPNMYSYTTAINAWARSEEGVKGAGIEENDASMATDTSTDGNNTGEEKIKSRNDDEPTMHKVAHARRLLDLLISRYKGGEKGMKPSAIPYTSVLNAAAHCSSALSYNAASAVDEGKTVENPYDIAFHTYIELIRDSDGFGLKPDHLVFAAMLQVVSKHTDPTSENRRIDVERVFDDACDAGQVSALVVRELQAACPSVDLLQRLLGSEQFAREGMQSVDELPSEWTKNVKNDSRLRRLGNRGAKKNSRRGRHGKGKVDRSDASNKKDIDKEG